MNRWPAVCMLVLVACGDPAPNSRIDAAIDTPIDAASGGGPRSCANEAVLCGTPATSCCDSTLVPGGSFFRRNDVDHPTTMYPATVSPFRLDRFEVTVGRFRAFVAAGMGTQTSPPTVAAGARTLNGMASQGGWDATWNALLPADTAALIADAKCLNVPYQTWTDTPGANETMPMNCVTWYVATAFCIWDGGFLPTDAERMFAAAGGDEQRVYPWSNPPSNKTADGTYANYGCLGDGDSACAATDLTAVGMKPTGNGRWGHADLAGNVWEWVLDCDSLFYTTDVCNDCADIQATCQHWSLGASYDTPDLYTRVVASFDDAPGARRANDLGMRCARRP